MKYKELFDEIRLYCKENADEANVIKYARYFKGEHNAYGLSQPQINSKVKELLKNPGLNLPIVLEAAPLLFENGKYEEITIALLLIDGFYKNFTKETFQAVGNLYALGINNWAHADALGMFIVPKFLKLKIIDYTELLPWLNSPYTFQRRTVPVAMIKMIKADGLRKEIIDFLEPLMMDKEREVHQGMGWFLREAWKINPSEIEHFLLKWKNKGARLIFQYATEKMSKDERVRFRKS
jgi:3-methyladenine DNA glycosylase AlkD